MRRISEILVFEKRHLKYFTIIVAILRNRLEANIWFAYLIPNQVLALLLKNRKKDEKKQKCRAVLHAQRFDRWVSSTRRTASISKCHTSFPLVWFIIIAIRCFLQALIKKPGKDVPLQRPSYWHDVWKKASKNARRQNDWNTVQLDIGSLLALH